MFTETRMYTALGDGHSTKKNTSEDIMFHEMKKNWDEQKAYARKSLSPVVLFLNAQRKV